MKGIAFVMLGFAAGVCIQAALPDDAKPERHSGITLDLGYSDNRFTASRTTSGIRRTRSIRASISRAAGPSARRSISIQRGPSVSTTCSWGAPASTRSPWPSQGMTAPR